MHQQERAPIADSVTVSGIVAARPILLLLVLLGVFRMRAYQAAAWSLLAARERRGWPGVTRSG